MADVQGRVEPGFEAVEKAFRDNFDSHGDVGAAFCLYAGGQPVVDLWGGIADEASGRTWDELTLALVYSTTKGAAAICAHRLAERGELDLDAPVSSYWPEFAAEGKADMPVRFLLSHRAGLAAIEEPALTVDDVAQWTPVVEALAAQRPNWEPGSTHGYHAITYGWLVGEVVRRVSGKSIGAFFQDEIAVPLGLDFWIGLPQAEEERVSTLIPTPVGEMPDLSNIEPERLEMLMAMAQAMLDPTSLTAKAFSNPAIAPDDWNGRIIHGAEIPAANGITTARSLARMYAALVGEVDGVRLLSPQTVDKATAVQSDGPDEILKVRTKFGLGFMLNGDFAPLGPGAKSFGHPGAGGSLGFADPETGLAFGYIMNKMNQNLSGDPRTLGLIDAAYPCLGAVRR
jgi:CubicO group peptidase (beta-lactamase class C family)